MDRREFVATGMGGAIGLGEMLSSVGSSTAPGLHGDAGRPRAQSLRSLFPRLENEVFVNGAGGTPLGSFAEDAVARYLDFARLGPGDGRGEWWGGVWSEVRGRFAELIGASESEIGLVECTKAGEQIVLDGVDAVRSGGNIVTNDLHFSGCLHNLEGLRRAGRDVRIVRSEDFDVSLERMADAMDDRTAIVSISLVSNVNGRVEPIAELAELAHARGAIVFADIIQAAGAVPIDVKAMGIDVAACSSYKWLFGIHGAGFLYVSQDVQGSAIRDSMFPGHVTRDYPPFVEGPGAGGVTWNEPADARRYQPGHVSYLGYAAVHAGLRFVSEVGVHRIQEHAVRMNRRLLDQIDQDRYRVLSTDTDRSPILALEARDFDGLRERLTASDVVISIGGDKWNLVRVSPAVYNHEADMDRVAEILAG